MKRSITGAFVALAIAAIVIFAIPLFLAHVRAQTAPANLPTSGNPVVAKIIDPGGNLTALQPLIVIQNSQLHVSVPEPTSSFRPGKYRLDLWIWQNGTIYYTENDFTWGVLVDDFDKSIYTIGDTVHAGFAVLDDTGNTICGADMSMDITSPTGKLSHFSTADGTITRNTTCGKNNVTESPDYSATLKANEAGTYSVAVTAATAAGKRTILDQFEAQNLPLFDVARSLPVRIYPPATYKASLTLKANTDFSGNIIETVPASFAVSNAGSAQITFSHNDTQSISWPANLRKGDSVTLGYSFKAPDVSPELYKLGPLQIGSW